MNDIVVPAGELSPALHIHVNPMYAMYHYVRRQAELPIPLVDEATANAAALMRQALNRVEGAGGSNMGGYHGLWDRWEPPLAGNLAVAPAIDGLRGAMMGMADALQASLSEAESIWMTSLWPKRELHIETGLSTLSDLLQPGFVAMCHEQAEYLDLVWPERLDAYLMTDCYDRFEAYTPPLTIDVAQSQGLELCETLLHEATHVAERFTRTRDGTSLSDRLLLFLMESGSTNFGSILDAQHALVFVSSGQQVRARIDPDHIHYAASRNLYQRLRVPSLPSAWDQYLNGGRDELTLFEAIHRDIAATV